MDNMSLMADTYAGMHPSLDISKFSPQGRMLEMELRKMESQGAPSGQIMQKLDASMGMAPMHELLALRQIRMAKMRRAGMNPNSAPHQSPTVKDDLVASVTGQPTPQQQPGVSQQAGVQQQQGIGQQPGFQQQPAPPQLPGVAHARHGGLADIDVHNIGHDERYARGGIVAFDEGGLSHWGSDAAAESSADVPHWGSGASSTASADAAQVASSTTEAEIAAAAKDPASWRQLLNKLGPKWAQKSISPGALMKLFRMGSGFYKMGILPSMAIQGVGDLYNTKRALMDNDYSGFVSSEDMARHYPWISEHLLGVDPEHPEKAGFGQGLSGKETALRLLGTAHRYGTLGLFGPGGMFGGDDSAKAHAAAAPAADNTAAAPTAAKPANLSDLDKYIGYSPTSYGIGIGGQGGVHIPESEAEKMLRDRANKPVESISDIYDRMYGIGQAHGFGQAAKQGMESIDDQLAQLEKYNKWATGKGASDIGWATMGAAGSARGDQPGYVGQGLQGLLAAGFQGVLARNKAKMEATKNYMESRKDLLAAKAKYADAMESDNRAMLKDAVLDHRTAQSDGIASLRDLASIESARIRAEAQENSAFARQRMEFQRQDKDPAVQIQRKILSITNYLSEHPDDPRKNDLETLRTNLSSGLQDYIRGDTSKGLLGSDAIQAKFLELNEKADTLGSPLNMAINKYAKDNNMTVDEAKQIVIESQLRSMKGMLDRLSGRGGGSSAAAPSGNWGKATVVGGGA